MHIIGEQVARRVHEILFRLQENELACAGVLGHAVVDLRVFESEIAGGEGLGEGVEKQIVKLLPAFDDEEAILSLRRQLTGHPLRDELEENLGRALQILDGSLLTDPVNRQFTTDPKGRGVRLQQRGDIAAYGRKLHYMFGLSNYLPTGICGNTGEKLTVYVEADEGQPLPRAVFTQFLTNYNHWQGRQIQLHRGVNILTVPALTYTPSYTNPGGPLYLVNPYTPQEQNESVKVYIEGGHLYPVFYKGGSEEKFKNDLHDFLKYYEENKDTAHNVAEVMSDHMLVTAQATRAGEIYLDGGGNGGNEDNNGERDNNGGSDNIGGNGETPETPVQEKPSYLWIIAVSAAAVAAGAGTTVFFIVRKRRSGKNDR